MEDEGHMHIGHEGAKDGRHGHFRVLVVSDQFQGIKPQSHATASSTRPWTSFMQTDIHALAIEAFTPDEWGSE